MEGRSGGVKEWWTGGMNYTKFITQHCQGFLLCVPNFVEMTNKGKNYSARYFFAAGVH